MLSDTDELVVLVLVAVLVHTAVLLLPPPGCRSPSSKVHALAGRRGCHRVPPAQRAIGPEDGDRPCALFAGRVSAHRVRAWWPDGGAPQCASRPRAPSRPVTFALTTTPKGPITTLTFPTTRPPPHTAPARTLETLTIPPQLTSGPPEQMTPGGDTNTTKLKISIVSTATRHDPHHLHHQPRRGK